MMGPDGDAPPFWSQPPPRRHRHQSSPIINPVVLILVVPIFLLILIFFVVPTFLSHANQLIRPNSVKKSWDYFNIVLVLFAILCGVFARRNDDVPASDEVAQRQNSDSVSTVSSFVNEPRHSVVNWLEFPDRKEYNNVTLAEAERSGGRLRRSSSSYPDLRHESLWESGGGNGGLRFYDDYELNFYRSRENFRQSHEVVKEEAVTPVREIPVDKFEVRSAAPPPTQPKSPPPPPPPPPPAAILKKRRTHRSVPHKEEQVERQRDEVELSENQPPAPPPAPLISEEPEFQFPEVISEIVPRKRSGVKKELATAIASLYKGQKRKRKKRVRSRDIHENTPENSSPPPAAVPPLATPPPPPPPPPPPSKMLQNLFKKSSKNKRVHSVPTPTAPPPPPPPPPPNSIFNNIFKSKRFQSSSQTPPPPPPPPPSSILNSIFKTGSKSSRFKNISPTSPPPPPPPPSEIRRRRDVVSGKPPKPPRPSNQYTESVIIAPPSPLIPMPPPPPPFRMQEVKFVAQGDFVRIRSEHSSRCSSPELEDFDAMSVKSDSEDLIGPSITCPSPDVNTKADNFIARLRDEWRLEKMNSMKGSRSLS